MCTGTRNSARHATPIRAIPPRLLRAYRQTNYRALDSVVRIGRRVPAALLAPLGGRVAGFITAWNPFSRRMPDGWNDRMQRRLRERLRRHAVLAAEGSLGRWREAMLLVAGDARLVVRLARMFRQCGVVVVQRGRAARLVLLPR